MQKTNVRKPGADLVAQEIPDPPPERDRGLRAPGEAEPEFSSKLSIPAPAEDAPAASTER